MDTFRWAEKNYEKLCHPEPEDNGYKDSKIAESGFYSVLSLFHYYFLQC